jgi:hypothetical protein
MAEQRTRDVVTLTVIGSETMARPDGRVAIRLDTQERGSIAFEVDQRAIDALRRQLATAEQILRQPTAKTKN